MVFTHQQILQMLNLLDKSRLIFIAQQVGLNYLTPAEKFILTQAGVDLNKFTNNNGIIEHAFLFGILAEAIGDKRAKNMSYADFTKFLASGQFIPLTEAEEFALDQIKGRAYSDITNLGQRMKNTLSNAALKNNQSRAAAVAQVIRGKAIKAIELRKSSRQLAAELAEASQDWEVDWLRIAYYLMHEAYNTGRAQSILKTYGQNAEVYFDVYEGACKECRELYLEDPDDIHSKPKVFKLVDVIQNGSNINVKRQNWKPTISPTHPYCRCTINYKDPKYDWDETTRSFSKVVRNKPLHKKLQGVNIDIKVSV